MSVSSPFLTPSEQVAPAWVYLSQVLCCSKLDAALNSAIGLPAGVLNLVHGGKESVDALLRHPLTRQPYQL